MRTSTSSPGTAARAPRRPSSGPSDVTPTLHHKSGRPYPGRTSNVAAAVGMAATAPVIHATRIGDDQVRPSFVAPAMRGNAKVPPSFGVRTQPRPPPVNSAAARLATRRSTTTAASASVEAKAMHTKAVDEADASVVVVGAERDSVAFRLCCQALAQGCVQTYMHLFELTHRDPVCVDALSRTYFVIPDQQLPFVQQCLSAMEVLRRQSEFAQVLAACVQLADYFEGERDLTEAAVLLGMGLGYMMESLDPALELEARCTFAGFRERHGQCEEAATLYEGMCSLALATQDTEGVAKASHCLVRVYKALGDAVKTSQPENAAMYYAKARTAAARGQSGEEVCAAYNALGEMSEARGDYPQALVYQRSNREVAHRENLKPQECHATLRVADLEERLGFEVQASATLQEALTLAKDLGRAEQLCLATMQLGESYRSHGQEAEALRCFDESFAAAVEAGNTELIERVRIAIGFARGDHAMTTAYNGEGYLHLVCTDIGAQLAWMSGGTL